jgi:transcription-repair coupling factor (superfamily II helicase)
VAREDLRIEAYRRLAAVTTEAEVADIETEWQDRYGLIPELAAALLTVARLRAECHRLGIGEIVAAGGKVRIKPIDLKMSQEVRLRRLVKDAVYKEDQGLLVLPLRHAEGLVDGLITLLRELVPDPASVASSVS